MFDKDAEEILDIRLVNWGLWGSIGGLPYLDLPKWCDIMRDYFPRDGRIAPNDIDAQHLEDKISSLDIAGRNGFGWGELYRRVFILEFKERGRPQSVKAKMISREFNRPVSMRTYRSYIYKGKRVLYEFVDPI